jgi:dephospho-CoA kinase
MPRIIGLTGGIASGKSLVSGTLQRLGMTVIDADDICHEILARDEVVSRQIVRAFGPEVLNEQEEIDRRKLGTIVFSQEPGRREALEEILHPLIREEMWRRVEEGTGSGQDLVLDVPLLIEAGEHTRVDLLVVVYTTTELQIQRLLARDGMSREEAARRVAMQLPLDEKVSYADYIVNNTGSVEETEEQVLRFYQVIRENETS